MPDGLPLTAFYYAHFLHGYARLQSRYEPGCDNHPDISPSHEPMLLRSPVPRPDWLFPKRRRTQESPPAHHQRVQQSYPAIVRRLPPSADKKNTAANKDKTATVLTGGNKKRKTGRDLKSQNTRAAKIAAQCNRHTAE